MTVNISERWRGMLYVFTAIGSIVVTYLGARDLIGTPELAAWTGFTAFIATLARFNLGHSPQEMRSSKPQRPEPAMTTTAGTPNR